MIDFKQIVFVVYLLHYFIFLLHSELDVSLALYSDIDNEEILDEESDKFR